MKETFNYLFRRILFAAFIGFVVFLLWNWFLVPTFGLTLINWKFCVVSGIASVAYSDIFKGQYIISEVVKPWALILWAGIIYLFCLFLH